MFSIKPLQPPTNFACVPAPAHLEEEEEVLSCNQPAWLKSDDDLGNIVKELLSDANKFLELDYGALSDFEATSNDQMKTSIDLITRINHFVNSNKNIFNTQLDALTFSIFIVGLTAAAKDVTSAQLLGNKHLADSGINMCTAANVHLFVNAADKEEYDVRFKGNRQILSNGQDYLAYMQRLMENIRNAEPKRFSTDSVIVKYTGESVTQASFGMNTMGLIPRSDGSDPVFKMINSQLNEKAEGGGIIVICSDITRPLDRSTAWLDFDVVQKWIDNRKQCKYQVILAFTKADLLTENHFGKVKTMKEMHEKIFGRFENLLPNTPMFAITGWIKEDGGDEDYLANKHREIIQNVMDRIENLNPQEANSDFKKKIFDKIGIEALKKYYFEAIYSQNIKYLSAVVDGFKSGLENLSRFSRELQSQLNGAENTALPIHDHLNDIEKLGIILRLNEHQRPGISLAHIEEVTPNYRFTLAEDFARVLQANPSIHLSVEACEISKKLAGGSLEFNGERFHAFWQLIERLHANAYTFASLYDLEDITKEEITAYITTASAKNSQDVENYILVKALHKCKDVFVKI